MFRAALIAMVADKLCLASAGDRLLFASTMTEFILQCFKGEEVQCLLMCTAFHFSCLSSSVNRDCVVHAK